MKMNLLDEGNATLASWAASWAASWEGFVSSLSTLVSIDVDPRVRVTGADEERR